MDIKSKYVNLANFDETKFNVANHDAARQVREEILKIFRYTVSTLGLKHSEDGLHYSEDDHEKVAERVYEKLKEIER